ncbi:MULTISPECIES: ABC transporter ATP-binding protein [Brevibacillus]|uniref:ABC transporter ATP-binding protein n=1 Tax=Brevibacillus invocatus TaxID=173959 RepID=A0A3M8BY61_9BACL|nr:MULTISPECIES: ABC transporter ATP-binding protein [Brevibacillus]MCM3079546.1 ABC transporter ATP-binding protein [Brevibacillus invocatus]MCM3429745.1 ABC transporter ATP-binding protein [Brevibacillus invocatus]MDH4618115.1 ABC transporter ATP-binding protein [Brevibacillus sp. AY1]RNB68293.1 ABC transporter ATP-binding protein [Brevibacillus invocatus]
MLNISGVNKVFNAGTVNEKIALNNVRLQVKSGEFITVIGSNGAGKSTLMNIISGGMLPDSGTVTIDGKNVTRLGEHQRANLIGRVFQDPMAGTAPNMTIEENLAIALARGKKRTLGFGVNNQKRELFREQLKLLDQGLENRLKTKVGFLSGGQRQALSLLMATFTEPKILLLDEHTAALDPKRAQLIVDLTEKIVERHKLTTIMVTHNMDQALNMGNRLLMLHDGGIILDIPDEKKRTMKAQDLLKAFEAARGGEAFSEDRFLLT